MEMMIPIFPCRSLPEILNFYQTLGFEVTHRQEEPYIYGAVRRGNIEIHFNNLTIRPAKNSVCLVMVAKVAEYHATFADALRTRYQRIPTAGLPRITRFRAGQTRFHVFDPMGNTLVFIDVAEGESATWVEATTPIEQVLDQAAFLRDTYCLDDAAAKMLDKSLAKNEFSGIERARLLASRAELAVALGEDARLQALRAEMGQLVLEDAERSQYQAELNAADALERWISHKD